jgi:hypothetical protein
MSRTKKIDEIDEVVVESEFWEEKKTVEQPVEPKIEVKSPVIEKKVEEKPKKMTIYGNPYLTDEQKAYLLKYELNKIRNKIDMNREVPVLLRYKDDGEDRYAVLSCRVPEVRDLWDLYKENDQTPTIKEFLALLGGLSTAPRFLGKDLVKLDLI